MSLNGSERAVPTGNQAQVTKQLRERGSELEYRIKRDSEPHERVARESELARE